MKRSAASLSSPTRRTLLVGAVLVASLVVAGVRVTPSVAGPGDGECMSSKLTNQLLDCAHCQAMKKLLGHAALGAVSMEVHDLEHGAIVEIEAGDPDAVKLVHQLVDELWNAQRHCETELSGACQARYHVLSQAVVDRALSSHGALVVLRGEDPETVAWLREDARSTCSIVLSAASR